MLAEEIFLCDKALEDKRGSIQFVCDRRADESSTVTRKKTGGNRR